jgi:DNA polymerase III alpha subunit
MDLKGRKTDEWGNVLFDSDGLIDHLMRGAELSKELTALENEGVSKFNALCRELDHPEDQVSIYEKPTISVEENDAQHQAQWFTPEPYASLDVLEWLVERCASEPEIQRIAEEWVLFEEREMIPVLRCLIYLVDNFRERGIVWGVGRGSSVASYILYKIGVHRVDSLAFDLDVREFLK